MSTAQHSTGPDTNSVVVVVDGGSGNSSSLPRQVGRETTQYCMI